MKRILILSIGLLFAAELEVDGVIKANSGIDANNNPITNVGSPLTMSDAINGNVLQDALRDDGVYEYRFYNVMWTNATNTHGYNSSSAYDNYREIGDGIGWDNAPSNWAGKMDQLSSEGWIVNRVITTGSSGMFAIYEFKRLITEE